MIGPGRTSRLGGRFGLRRPSTPPDGASSGAPHWKIPSARELSTASNEGSWLDEWICTAAIAKRPPGVGVRHGIEQGVGAAAAHLQDHGRACLGGGSLAAVALGHRPRLHAHEQQAGRHGQHRGDPGGARPSGDAGPADQPGRTPELGGARDPPPGDAHEHPRGEQAAGDRHHPGGEHRDRARPVPAVVDQLHDARRGEHDHHHVDHTGASTGTARRHPPEQLGNRSAEDLARGEGGDDETAGEGTEDGQQHRPGQHHLGARREDPVGRGPHRRVADDGAQRSGHQQEQQHLGQPEAAGLSRGQPAQLGQTELGERSSVAEPTTR